MHSQILARNPTDHFTFNFYQWCLPQIPENSLVYYIWAEPFEIFDSMIESINCDADNVFLFISDNLCLYDFNPWTETYTWGVEVLRTKIKNFPNTRFVIYSDVANLEPEFSDLSNVDLIQSEYLTMDQLGWQQVDIVTEKNFSSERHWVSLNHRPAAHRISSASYIMGSGLDRHCQLVTSTPFVQHISKYKSYLDMVAWEFSKEQEQNLKPKICQGFDIIKNWKNINDDYDLKNAPNKFGENFTQYLSSRYEHTFVEIVKETYYAEPSFMCTEKFLNSVYGCNFPIFLGGAGMVSHLEKLGFDLFRDVVNHDYDRETNPLIRLQLAYDLNQGLLMNPDLAMSQWKKHKDRLVANARFAQTLMYDFIWQRLTSRFNELIAQ